jgi:hypothetical protein
MLNILKIKLKHALYQCSVDFFIFQKMNIN